MGCLESKSKRLEEDEEREEQENPQPVARGMTRQIDDDVDGPRADLDPNIRQTWEREQDNLKRLLILENTDEWARDKIAISECPNNSGVTPLQYVGGVDISFVKDDNVNACAAFVVVRLPTMEPVYEDYSMIQLTEPYIPGFLAFREVSFLVEKVNKLKTEKPHLMPQIIMVDGNGILHVRGFGLACHLGVLTDIPTLGVAKKLFYVDGIEKGEDHKRKIKEDLLKGGDYFNLVGNSGKIHGVAMRSTDSSSNPVYVSQGHKLSLETAVWAVSLFTKHRVPEPVRLADINSREYIRQNWPVS